MIQFHFSNIDMLALAANHYYHCKQKTVKRNQYLYASAQYVVLMFDSETRSAVEEHYTLIEDVYNFISLTCERSYRRTSAPKHSVYDLNVSTSMLDTLYAIQNIVSHNFNNDVINLCNVVNSYNVSTSIARHERLGTDTVIDFMSHVIYEKFDTMRELHAHIPVQIFMNNVSHIAESTKDANGIRILLFQDLQLKRVCMQIDVLHIAAPLTYSPAAINTVNNARDFACAAWQHEWLSSRQNTEYLTAAYKLSTLSPQSPSRVSYALCIAGSVFVWGALSIQIFVYRTNIYRKLHNFFVGLRRVNVSHTSATSAPSSRGYEHVIEEHELTT